MRPRIIFAYLIVSLAAAVNSSAQTLTTLVSFDGTNGAAPAAPLIQGSDGNLYGTTQYGGTINACNGGFNPCGTVFKITTSGMLTTYSLNYNDGAYPVSPVVQGSDGNLYGTNQGTEGVFPEIFRMTSSGTFTALYSVHSAAGLVQGSDGNFYGTTQPFYNNGTVFKITPSGAFTTLYTFSGTGGANPSAALILGTDGNFYGTTDAGGANNDGTVFKITPSGSLTTLHSFNGSDGYNVAAGLVQGTDGNFYGTTVGGGKYVYDGTVFRITPSGTLTTLYSFCVNGYPCTDGANPVAGLVQAKDGNFYGTTSGGGAYGHGTIFVITPSGSLTALYSFCPQSGCADGASPVAGLIQASDGKFYGTTQQGGANSLGTVFRFTPPPIYTLSVYKIGNGTVTGSDSYINCGNVCSYNYVSGAQVTLTATPSSGWVFGNWSGCDQVNNNVCTVTMNNNRTVTPTFTPTYQLTVSKTGNGTVTSGDGYINCGGTCSHTYTSGAVVTLTASPDPNWVFTSWSGCDQVNNNVCTVTVNNNRTATATFTPTYQLTVTETGSGTVTSSDGYISCGSTCSHTYVSGTVVTLTASPAQGWGFASWSGCDQSKSNVCLLVMKADRTATATFKVLYALSASKTGNGTVASGDGHIYCGSACSYSYLDGTQVGLTAIPAPGYTLSGWTGCNNGNGNYCAVTMTSAKNVTASFTLANVTFASLPFKPNSVKGGQLSVAKLTLSAAAPPGGVAVGLSSDHPSVAHPPSFVLIPGGKTSLIFAVYTFPVKTNTLVMITATAGSSHISGTFTVGTSYPLQPTVSGGSNVSSQSASGLGAGSQVSSTTGTSVTSSQSGAASADVPTPKHAPKDADRPDTSTNSRSNHLPEDSPE